MVKTKRLVAVALAILMILGSLSMTAYAWSARTSDGSTLTINTEILREVNGEWVKTDKVDRGETVKARVYLGTDYYTNSGDLLFFYSNEFFSDAYGAGINTLVVNPYYASSYGIEGDFFASASTAAQAVEAQMLRDSRITTAIANDYNPINVAYSFGSNVKNKQFDASKWFCEFVLTVNDDAPAGEFGYFLAYEATAASPEYNDGYINVPKGAYSGYVENTTAMFNWDATLKFTNTPVEVYQNLVVVDFNANGGTFNDGTATKHFEGDAGSALSVEDPALDGYEFAGWLAAGATEATEVTAYPNADTTYTAVWTDPDSGEIQETLGFRTEIHRLNEETGEYEKTERVERGETVKARLFVDTSYFTNAGDIIVFYDNDFFTDAYPTDEPAAFVANTSATSSAAILGVEGRFAKTANTNKVIKNLVNKGYITDDQAKETNAFTIAYEFNPTDCAKISGDEWFVEFDLQVLNTAEGYGDFYIIPSTIQNSGEGWDAYINIPLGEEGMKYEDGEHLPMFDWDVIATVESNPVTVESAITLDGAEGTFAENGEGTYVIEGFIGAAPAAPAEPTREGYAFMGWVDENGEAAEIPAEMPLEDITLYATWSKKVNVTFILNNGEANIEQEAIAGQPFEAPADPVKEGYDFFGWDCDENLATIEKLPAVYSEEDATYTAVFEAASYYAYYYVLNPVDLQFDLVAVGSFDFGQEINPQPMNYTALEGYTLSPAYKDITFTTALADGETMPAGRVDLYYKLTINTYNAIFDADGGVFADGSDEITVPTVYGENVIAPAAPTKEGFNFMGWAPAVGTMQAEDTVYTATWEEATYNAIFNVDGAAWEVFPTVYGEEIEVPADPHKDGYTFTGWTPEVAATMPAHDTVYEAVFEANKYDAIFKLEADDEEAYAVKETVFDTAIEVPEDPTKTGYVFGGWIDENGNPVGDMDEEGKTFYAVWNPATDTKYVIETYTMNTDGTYNETPDGTVEKSGTTGATVEVTPNAGEGKYVDEEKSVLSAEIAADGSTALKVYYAREEVTVTFKANGGKLGEAEEVVLNLYYGAAVVAPADPTREGYTFGGWDPAVVNKALEDATYTAKWTVNQYTITFDTDGGEEIAPITQDYATDIVAPADPAKKGYTFDGWVDAEGNAAEVPATMPAEDVALKATWTANTYDATFDADGGAWADGSTEQNIPTVFDTAITEPAEAPEMDGYDFGGWVDEDGNAPGEMTEEGKNFKPIWLPAEQEVPVEIYIMGTDGEYPDAADETTTVTFKTEETATYAPAEKANYTVDAAMSVLEAVVEADGSTVLKVYYALNETTITFNVDGETTEIAGLVGTDVPADEVPAPEKEGYTFAGWADADGNAAEVPATMPAEDVTLNATWTVNVYEVTFVVDGTVVDGYPTEVEFGATIPVAANPSKGGYIFLGWKDADGKTPAEYGTMPSKDLEFTAQWSSQMGVGYVLEVYEMNTNGEYDDVPTSTINFADGVVGEIRSVEYTAPTGFTLDLAKSELSGEIPDPAENTLVLKAYAIRNQYTLTVVVDDETTETEYYYGAAVTAPETPVKEGTVEFAGWVDADGNAATVPAIMPAEDVTVYASWTTSAKFDAGEGTFADGTSVKEIPVEEGAEIVAPEDPVKEGYDFVGWGTEANPETPIDDFGTMDDNGETYVAIWTESTYAIIFVDLKAPANGPNAPIEEYELATGDIKYNGKVILPDDPTFGDGTTYEFVGWFDADGNEYKEGDIYTGTEDLVLYAEYTKVAVKLVPIEGSTTVVDRDGVRESYNDGTDRDGEAYTPVNGVPYDEPESFEDYYIYGIDFKQRDGALLSDYFTVLGDGRIEIIHVSSKYSCAGTGSVVNVYDRLGTEETTDDVLVESFYIVIFGDVNGDAAANSLDASIIEEEALGVTSWSSWMSDEYRSYKLMAADVNYDSKVKSLDSSLVEHYALGVGEIDQVSGLATTLA